MARRYQAGDLPLDDALGLFGVFHLVADGDGEALVDQTADVAGDRVMRNAGHGDRVRCILVTRGERELELPSGDARVVKETARKKSPHAEQEDRIAGTRLFASAYCRSIGVKRRPPICSATSAHSGGCYQTCRALTTAEADLVQPAVASS